MVCPGYLWYAQVIRLFRVYTGYLGYAQVIRLFRICPGIRLFWVCPGYLGCAQVIWGVPRLFGVCTGYMEAGKQRDLCSNLLRLSFLFKSCVLWTF